MNIYKLIIICTFFIVSNNGYSQQYYNSPGINKFSGYWRYIDGSDTLTMQCVVRYFEFSSENFVQGANFYYSYKQGSSLIYNNLENENDIQGANFGGAKPYGPNLDTLQFAGRDHLKRKRDEGYVVINAANNQLKFVRDPEITGGGIQYHSSDNPPLPGWTIPSGIVFTRYTIPPTGGD